MCSILALRLDASVCVAVHLINRAARNLRFSDSCILSFPTKCEKKQNRTQLKRTSHESMQSHDTHRVVSLSSTSSLCERLHRANVYFPIPEINLETNGMKSMAITTNTVRKITAEYLAVRSILSLSQWRRTSHCTRAPRFERKEEMKIKQNRTVLCIVASRCRWFDFNIPALNSRTFYTFTDRLLRKKRLFKIRPFRGSIIITITGLCHNNSTSLQPPAASVSRLPN